MQRGKAEQGAGHVESGIVERKQGVLEQEPEIAGHLVVARSPGVQALSRAGILDGEPLLDGGMHVLLPPVQLQLTVGDGAESPAQASPDTVVFRRGKQPGGAQALDVAEASEHVPTQQSRVPDPVVPRGVLEHLLVEGAEPQRVPVRFIIKSPAR